MEPEMSDPSPAEEPARTRGSSPVAGLLSLVGGALLVVGSFLVWAEVSGAGTSVTATGMEGSDGWITLAAGVLAIIAGAGIASGTGGRGMAVLATVAGLIGGGVGLFDAVTVKDSFLDSAAEDLAREFGGSVEQLRALLDAAIQAGELDVRVSVGLYLVIAGGALAIAGGAIALGRGSGSGAPAIPATPATPSAEAAPSPDVPGVPTEPPPGSAGIEPPPPPPAPPAPEDRPAPDTEPPPATGSETQATPGSQPSGTPATEPPPSPWAIPEPSDREDPGAGEDER